MSKIQTVYMVYELNNDRTRGFSYAYETEDDAISHMACTPDDYEVWYVKQQYELEEEKHDCGDDE